MINKIKIKAIDIETYHPKKKVAYEKRERI